MTDREAKRILPYLIDRCHSEAEKAAIRKAESALQERIDREKGCIEVAEILSDILRTKQLNENEISAICYARNEIMCRHSKIGQYTCLVKTHYGWCCDTCLQDELEWLKRDNHICTIGSCCGHGVKQPFIQVDKAFCEKMLELGYERLPLDEHVNGEWCFKPKTILCSRPLKPAMPGEEV